MSTEGISLLKWFEQFWFYYCSWVQFKVKIGTIVSCTPGLISGWARENKSLFFFPLGMTPFAVNKVIFCSQSKPILFTSLQPKPHYTPLLSSASLSFLCISLHSHCTSAQAAQPLLRGISQDILSWKGLKRIFESNSSVHHPYTAQIHDLGDMSTVLPPSWWIFNLQPKNSQEILPYKCLTSTTPLDLNIFYSAPFYSIKDF